MKQVNIGLVGCGGMGRSLAFKLLDCDDRLKVTALFDPDRKSIDRTREKVPGARVCEDYGEMLALPDLHWVMIASWNCFHCDQVVAAFEAGKHVFCQKPLAINIDQCLRMVRAWRDSKKMFNIGFTLRYSPHYRKLKELVAGGAIGRVISMEFNETLDFNHGGFIMGDWRRLRENAGTHLLEKCCHDIDLVNWMIGCRVARVASFGGLDFFVPENAGRMDSLPARLDGKKAYDTWGGLVKLNPFLSDKDIVDNQVAIMQYENGVRTTFHTNCNAAIPERRMYILGTDGTIRADVLQGTIELKKIGFGTEIEDYSTSGSGGHGGGDKVLARELADSMLKQVPPSVGMQEGLESSVVCFAMDQALDNNEVVSLAPLWHKVGQLTDEGCCV